MDANRSPDSVPTIRQELSWMLMAIRQDLSSLGTAIRQHSSIFARWCAELVASQKESSISESERKAVILVIVFICMKMFIFLSFVWFNWCEPPWQFWLSALTGNWSPDKASAVGPFWFTVSVLFGIM